MQVAKTDSNMQPIVYYLTLLLFAYTVVIFTLLSMVWCLLPIKQVKNQGNTWRNTENLFLVPYF